MHGHCSEAACSLVTMKGKKLKWPFTFAQATLVPSRQSVGPELNLGSFMKGCRLEGVSSGAVWHEQ